MTVNELTGIHKLKLIESMMRSILLVGNDDKPGTYMPVKNTTRQDCYKVLYAIQKLLGTNIICIGKPYEVIYPDAVLKKMEEAEE